MSDKNLNSFVGPDDNGRVVDLGDIAVDPTVIASPIKCTQLVQGLVIMAGTVTGGHDAIADVQNRAKDVVVSVAEARPQGQFVGLVKGGASGIHYHFTKIVGRGKVAEFIFDDWSDQCHDATKGCSLDARMADGSAVRVICLKTKPSLVAGSGPYVFPWWQAINWRIPFTQNYYVVGFIFDTIRRWGAFRSQSNNPTN